MAYSRSFLLPWIFWTKTIAGFDDFLDLKQTIVLACYSRVTCSCPGTYMCPDGARRWLLAAGSIVAIAQWQEWLTSTRDWCTMTWQVTGWVLRPD